MGSRISLALVACGLALVLLGGAAATSHSRSSALPPLSFRPSPAWWTVTTGAPSSRVDLAPQVWAITTHRSDAGALVPFDLFNDLRRLSRNAILVWALTAGRGGTNGTFTRGTWPLRLSSFRVDQIWEGQPTLNVQQRLRWASVRGWRLDVRVYFATQHPSRRLLREA